MKNVFYLFLFISITSIPAKESLVVIDNVVNKAGLYIIEKVGDRFIAVADDDEIRAFQQQGLVYKILDDDPRSKKYYLVFPTHDDEKAVARVGTILERLYNPRQIAEHMKCLLVRLSEKNETALFDLKVDLNHLKMSPMVFNPVMMSVDNNKRVKHVYDPLIQKMVDSVSEDTLRAFIRYLTDSVSSRSARYKSNRDEAVPWICQKFRDYGLDSVYTQDVPDYEYAPNPIGVKLGKKYPSYSRYFIIGGHCDAVPHASVNKGADDNATGIAATIEAARIMSRFNFEYTIVFMGFNGEEVGLVGSAEYAEQAKARGDTILAALTHDMLGRASGSADYLRVRYPEDISSGKLFSEVYDEAASTYTDLKYSIGSTSGTGGSDHASFIQQGFNAFFLIESAYSSNEVNHSIDDTLDCPDGLNDTKYFTQCTQGTIACIAMGPVGNSTGATVIEEVTDIAVNPKKAGKSEFVTVYNSGNRFLINFKVNSNKIPVTIRIYNSIGKVINTILLNDYHEGINTVTWDGCDYGEGTVSNGVYFIECSTNGKKLVRKVMITR